MGEGSDERAIVAVVGAGTMGAGIAQVALEGGWRVRLHDAAPGATDRAIERIRQGLTRRATKAGESDPERAATRRLLDLAVVSAVADAAEGAHLAIEAVVEDLEAKRRIFTELDDAAEPEAVLATNTSALSVTSIAEATTRPDRVVGLHFFNPAPVLPLVEVVAGARSAGWAVERAAGIVEGWGKTPIRVTDSPGFIVNRVNRPFTLEPLRLLRAGAGTVESIDAALVVGRIPDGAVRAHGPHRDRRESRRRARPVRGIRAAAAVPSVADPGGARGRRPARAKDGRGLLPLRGRAAPAALRRASSGAATRAAADRRTWTGCRSASA